MPPIAARDLAAVVLRALVDRHAGLDPAAIDDARSYRVASSDWVLDSYGGYALKDWRLRTRYDFPLTIREAIEAQLARS